MYKFVVITDPDTSAGYRLAGVEAYDAAGPGQAKELLAALSLKEGIGIVAVSEELLEGLDEKFRDRMERLRIPIVIAIPSRLKNVDRRLYIERLMRKAIGYNIVMRG
jgi:V/A-type H+-transporting ATPase subunit F